MSFWIPLAASAGSTIFNELSQRGERKKANRLRDQFTRDRDQSLDSFRQAIGQLETRAGDINEDETVDDLFGDIIQSLTDRTQAGTDSATRDVFRTMMASGGDVTGQGAGLVNSLREGGNKSVSDIVNRFTELTNRRNLHQRGRADQLYGTAMGTRGNLFSSLSGLATDAQGRVDRRSTAGRQFLLDAVGMGLQSFGQLKSNE